MKVSRRTILRSLGIVIACPTVLVAKAVEPTVPVKKMRYTLIGISNPTDTTLSALDKVNIRRMILHVRDFALRKIEDSFKTKKGYYCLIDIHHYMQLLKEQGAFYDHVVTISQNGPLEISIWFKPLLDPVKIEIKFERSNV